MKKRFNTTISEEVIIKAKGQCFEENRSVSDLIEQLLKEYLGMER